MEPADRVFSVAQLTQQIRALLENEIGDVWVEGEISNHRLHSSGHQYFTLKDERAQIQCVLFRGAGARLAETLRDGQQVQVFGGVTVYEQRGNYQIIVRLVQPKGLGSLQARFEALKRKLEAEGLFESQWKKEIPRFPRVVALVTSPTGAAIRDMINILSRRAPWLRILVFPVRVQGQGGETEIARAIGLLNRAVEIGLPQPDTIVVGRGGGSLEDLWNFNEEVVARAIFASEIPVISAVGHEIDFTIADFVADLRAPTPSAAAELLAPDIAELRRHFDAMQKTLAHRVGGVIEQHARVLELTARGQLRSEPGRQLREAEQRLDDLEDRFDDFAEQSLRSLEENLMGKQRTLERYRPGQVLAETVHRIELLQQRANHSINQRISHVFEQLVSAEKLLQSLGPDGVLQRGFSLTLDPNGRAITDAGKLKSGERVRTKLARGEFASVVE
ncbi:MAG: exodeoxyribonuclease VII large subunit [Verrucomicrobia bacterium]|nr:exodeoxyribonuclease VII large subunit [Verrucomicrobiota bacterium]